MPNIETIRYMHREKNVKEILILKKINGEQMDYNVNFIEFKNFMNLKEYAQKRANKYMSLYNPSQPLTIEKRVLLNNLKSEKKHKFEKQLFQFNYAWDVVNNYLNHNNDHEHYCNSINYDSFVLNYQSLIDFFQVFKYLKRYANKEINKMQNINNDKDNDDDTNIVVSVKETTQINEDHDVLVFNTNNKL